MRAVEPGGTWRELSGALLGVAVLTVVLAVVAGIWVGRWEAAAVTVGLALTVIAGLSVWFTRRATPAAADAPHVRPSDDPPHRILVVADDRWLDSRSISELLAHAGGQPVSVFVTAPALASRLDRLTADQSGYDDATRRLKVTIEALRRAGLRAEGAVGATDPLQAADDGMRRFPADEIVFVSHPDDQTRWLKEGVVARARSRYEAPVRHIAVS